MASATRTSLKEALKDGLTIFSRIWDYKAKNWVMCIAVADIDGDGDVEIIFGSRDGRIHCLSKTGKLRWQCEIGTRAWVGTIAISGMARPGEEAAVRIIVGTRDGKVYILDSEGRLLAKDGKKLLFNEDGQPLDRESALEAYWFNINHVIRSIHVDPLQQSLIIIGSEDRNVYALDLQTGEQRWQYPTGGPVHSVFACDLNGDEQDEVLFGSVDGNLYVLDLQGRLLTCYTVGHPIRTIFVEGINQDNKTEVLLSTDHKNLIALTYCDGQFLQKWEYHHFENRLLTLYAVDIDGDGQKEIIGSCEDKRLYILDAEGRLIWRHNHKYRTFDIATSDIDNDGLPELLIGDENQRIRAMHVRLRRGVAEKIRRHYQRLEKPGALSRLKLDKDERILLQDVAGLNARKLVKFEQAKEYMAGGDYTQALSTLLRLAQQRVEQVWSRNDMEYIRTLCFRNTARQMGREIVIGTADGRLSAFYASGRRAWSIHLKDHIVDVQSGFIEHHSPKEDILICSSNHNLYILGGGKKPLHRIEIANAWMSSICVRASSNREAPEIIIGSEAKKLFIYDHDLQTPKAELLTEEGVSIVRAHPSGDENTPEIIVAGLNNRIYAYRRNGKQPLWKFETFDHIKAVCIKDINNDGQPEILVGAEDRNIHVLDSTGHLLWRFYLPHSALTIDAADIDQDGMVEIFVGCADGNLYVFNRDGNLLWTYQAKDRIHAVRIGDIDGDGHYEIALGAEDEFELLRIVNQQQIADTIAQCWKQLCQQSSPENAIARLLENDDVFLQAFALNKLAESGHLQARDFDAFEGLAKEGVTEVRLQLARLLPTLYTINPARARTLLGQLSTDLEYEVRNVTIDCLPALMRYDWDEGFYYLKRAIENSSRFVRRLAVRKIDELIGSPAELLLDRHRRHQVFGLLLIAAQDKGAKWVRQEAAHVLAHYLDQHQGSLIVYTHLFIVKNLQDHVWEQIAYVTTSTIVRRYITAVRGLLYGLNENNVQQRLQQMVQAQQGAENLLYGKDLRLIYKELYHLFTLDTLNDISQYQYRFAEHQFAGNQFAHAILPVFKKLQDIARPLKLYFRREDLQDRLNSLLEAGDAIDRTLAFLKQQYATMLLGEPMGKLPDYQVFLLLFKKWQVLLQEELSKLRGKARLRVTLLTRDICKEKQVGILVEISNEGQGSASDVRLTLLHSDAYQVIGKGTFQTEFIAAGEGTTAEFILAPRATTLPLEFEIVFDAAADKMVVEKFTDCIELRDWQQDFRPIPNRYSTGLPAQIGNLFYGREEDIDFLKDNLTRDTKSVIVLYGQRRSGKTSLLLRLINSSILGEHIPVFLDMQRLSYHITIENFLRRVAYLIERTMKQKDLPIQAPPSQEFDIDPIHAFDVFLDQIEEQLSGRKLILLIDEFEVLEEQVTRGQLEPEIFEYLRDIVQHRANINFLFSGTHKITEFTKWYRSVFFHIAIHYRLSRLTPQDAADLIQKPVAGYLEYEPLTVTKIRQLTADQPYLIHLISRAIIDYCNKQHKSYVTINDVNIVQREVMGTGQFHFDWLWDQIKPEERTALSAITECSKEEGRWIPFSEIEEIYRQGHFPYRNDYFIDTLKMLKEADIIEVEQEDSRKSRFRIAVGLIRIWMLREHPLELVGKEMNG